MHKKTVLGTKWPPAVNFTTILRAAFASIFFYQKRKFKAEKRVEKSCAKHILTKKVCVKC